MAPLLGKICILVLFPLLDAGHNHVTIRAGGELKGQRAVISYAEQQTEEDRRVYLQEAKEQGYTCWMFPDTDESAVCIQNPANIYSDLPETPQDLRLTLVKVNLRDWLPRILCGPSPVVDNYPSAINSSLIDHTLCVEVAMTTLVAQPDVELVLTDSRRIVRQTTTISVATHDTPWLKVMQSWIGWGDAHHLGSCSATYIGFASLSARMQLRPTLWALAGGENEAADTKGNTSTSTSPALPSAERIRSLLTLIDSGNDQINKALKPSLRMTFPRPGGRLSGHAIPFIGEVVLGAALTARRDRTQAHSRNSQQTDLLPAEHRLLRAENDGTHSGGDNWNDFEGYTDAKLPEPDFDRCEVRVVVDHAVVSTFPIAAAAPADDGGTGTSADTSTVAIETALFPNYERNVRCTEHPVEAAKEGDAWTDDQFDWLLETRAIDRVCTRETFGAHRIYGELACRRSAYDGVAGDQDDSKGENVADIQEALAEEGPSTPPDHGTPPPPPHADWRVLATSRVVEYFHTGNMVDVLSSHPWTGAAEEAKYDTGNEEAGGSGGTNVLLTPPPENLTVSLYLENDDPANPLVVVAVPRWLSDGELWEAAYSACTKSVGPSQGILVNQADCVDLVTSAIAAKRVDLYNIMSLRLSAYIKRVNQNLVFEGHTGAYPEKVAALGDIAREGAGNVRAICEVGFNAGHSSLNWLLSSHPSTKVLAFDLGVHDYVAHALDFLQAVFPGRLELVVGNSRETVPAYSSAEVMAGRDPHVCDVVFVDGDHTEEGAYADLVNFQALASRDRHVLAIDDMGYFQVEAAWRRFREEGRGRLEGVVRSTSEHYAHSLTNENGDIQLNTHAVEHNSFMLSGHESLGIGRYSTAKT